MYDPILLIIGILILIGIYILIGRLIGWALGILDIREAVKTNREHLRVLEEQNEELIALQKETINAIRSQNQKPTP